MLTAILFDLHGVPLGRGTIPEHATEDDAPIVVTWAGRTFVHRGQKIAGHTYNEVQPWAIVTLRAAPVSKQ